MEASIDKAGRVVVPASLRERVGLTAGPVTITVVGTGVLIEPVVSSELVRTGNVLMIRTGTPLTDDDVRNLRLADQR